MNAMKKMIIFGSQGMLGTDVFSVFSEDKKYHAIPLSHFNYDLLVPEEIQRAFEDHKPDIVINCSGFTDVDSAEFPENEDLVYGTNADAPAMMAYMCKQHDALLVHYSTDYVFNGKEGGYDEMSPIDPVNVYGDSKVEGEMGIWENTDQAIIIRTSRLFGSGRDNLISKIIASAKKGIEITAITDERGNYTFTKDLAEATKKLLESQAEDYGVFHLCGKDVLSPYEVAKKIVNKMESHSPVQKISAANLNCTAIRPKDPSLVSVRTSITLPVFDDSLARFLSE